MVCGWAEAGALNLASSASSMSSRFYDRSVIQQERVHARLAGRVQHADAVVLVIGDECVPDPGVHGDVTRVAAHVDRLHDSARPCVEDRGVLITPFAEPG